MTLPVTTAGCAVGQIGDLSLISWRYLINIHAVRLMHFFLQTFGP